MRSVLPATQPLVATIHLQFAVPTVFWPPKPPLHHRLPMQNSLYPMMNGKFGNVTSQCPIRTTANSGPTLYLCDTNKMCCTFVPSVQNLMPVVFYFCDGLFTVKEAKQATLQLPRFFFSTVARFELEPQIRETQSYQTSSSGNMPRRNLHCKYYVLKHITIQALEATQSHNAPSLTMLTLYHCKLQLRPFHFEVW